MPHGALERMEGLREAVARIEGAGVPCLAQRAGVPCLARHAGALSASRASLGEGLDRLLRGGLSRGTLSEVVADSAGDAGAAAGFALALAARFAAGSSIPGGLSAPVVWILEDAARAEGGAPYAPGLALHGLALDTLVLVRAASGTDALWAAEEALKCRAVGAVVVELWRAKAYDLVASRRLALAAAAGDVPGLLVPAGTPGVAAGSAAHARFVVAATPGRSLPTGKRAPLPGRAAFAVRLARIRAGPAGLPAGFDPDRVWPLVWDHQEAVLRDALPLPPPALPRDRPHPAAAGGGAAGRAA